MYNSLCYYVPIIQPNITAYLRRVISKKAPSAWLLLGSMHCSSLVMGTGRALGMAAPIKGLLCLSEIGKSQAL